MNTDFKNGVDKSLNYYGKSKFVRGRWCDSRCVNLIKI